MSEEDLDLHDLRKALEKAQDRLDLARVRAEAAAREYFWGLAPDARQRESFQAAMREEADALLAVEALRRAFSRRQARAEEAAGSVG